MRILVACEESQAVTKELRKLGHEAYSCDILKCSGGRPEWHQEQGKNLPRNRKGNGQAVGRGMQRLKRAGRLRMAECIDRDALYQFLTDQKGKETGAYSKGRNAAVARKWI